MHFTKLITTIILMFAAILLLPQAFTDECTCVCRLKPEDDICKLIQDLKVENDAIKETVRRMMDWQKNIERSIEKLEVDAESHTKMSVLPQPQPSPENLILKPADEEKVDLPLETMEGRLQLAKNVSTLLAKVEEVENMTVEVQEFLKSERRVRRHLEEDLNETRFSIKLLDDRLQNVTAPVDSRMTHVEEIVFSTLDSLNKTLFEDHLQKLYYKVEGVVYKNETEKLEEELQHLKTELHATYNSSAVSDLINEISDLGKTLISVNNSVQEKLVILYLQNGIQDEKFQEMENKVELFSNNTELFREQLEDVWNNVRHIQDFHLKFQNVTEERINRLEMLKILAENSDDENAERGNATSASEDLREDETRDGKSTDESTSENPLNEGIQKDEYEILKGVANGTDRNSEKLEYVVVENEEKKDTLNAGKDNEDYHVNEIMDYFYDEGLFKNTVPETTTTQDAVPEADENNVVETRDERRISEGKEASPCRLPDNDDGHLLVSMEEDSAGKQALVLGCRPIGQYVLRASPVPLACENGKWRGPFPECVRLLNESEIEGMAQEIKKENPCLISSGDFPDPTNCSRFLKCSHGWSSLMDCPPGLHFHAIQRICDFPIAAKCNLSETKSHDLLNIVPPIRITPKTLDKPNTPLGTGKAGQLVVLPGASFSFHCFFPENVWGRPVWNVQYAGSNFHSTLSNIRYGRNEAIVTVASAKEVDSGVYSCRSPFGIEHSIEVIVKAIKCPLLTENEDDPSVFYRPTPEGQERVLGTKAEFQCEGHMISAVCLATGEWSREPPDEDECTVKKPGVTSWKCPPIDARDRPGLLLEADEDQSLIHFDCIEAFRLEGVAFTRCTEEGEWTHDSLPKCEPKKSMFWNCPPLYTRTRPNLLLEMNENERSINFRCSGHLKLDGNSRITCREDGLWTHSTLPKCISYE